MRQLHSRFFKLFSIFWIAIFLNGFLIEFIVHFRLRLFEPNFYFSLVVFCSHSAFWHWFRFFFNFLIWFFRIGFPNSPIVRSRSSFMFSQWQFFEMYVRTCPVMIFTCRINFFRITLVHSLFNFFCVNFAWILFDFARLVSLFPHSAKSVFERHLLSKAIQNEQSQIKNWSQK